MKIKFLQDEDFVNYKKPSMFIGFPSCSWKCEKECGIEMCQNKGLALEPIIDIDIDSIIERYLNNNITSAIVCGGLEPFDSFEDLYELIKELRLTHQCNDDIVIYTGYNEDEIQDKLKWITNFKNIIIKFGRYIPNQKSHLDEILGVELASDNQYAKLFTHEGNKVITNPDIDYVNHIRSKLKANDGYCPCRLEKNDETYCMCQEFRDDIKIKKQCECHCSLYFNV